ncbi:hypothetical protein [Parvibaculum sp.]|uniref:hypothetical protein n=1 Tax=Parvibaculum sp. TaxID=2024848 RepID=UPI001B2E0005|nr:hypothetical protein [Parvibaculum sp.]MBO6668050.1 hypothetical protein [Parvibaculum sp.]MBO6715634.1 hypothetical protein [Parvibaculum sp.]
MSTGQRENVRKLIIRVGTFSYFVGVTIGFASVNEASLVAIPYVRSVALSLAALCSFFYLLSGFARPTTIAALAIAISTYSYGLLLGLDNLEHFALAGMLFQSIVVVSFGTLYVSISDRYGVQESLPKYYAVFAFLCLAFLVMTNGVNFNFPPSFQFSLFAESGSAFTYSQGVSAFFGLAAICSLWNFLNASLRRAKVIHLIFFLCFLLFSLVGGARGEVFFLVVVVLMMSARNGAAGRRAISLLAVLAIGLLLVMDGLALGEVTIVKRFFEIFSGQTLGYRDVLFSQAASLLTEEPGCLFIGCGYAHFQAHYGYSYGFYPHNLLLEAVITWGIFNMVILSLLFSVGLKGVGRFGLLEYLALFFLLIGMKSGDLIGSWLAMSFFYYYCGIGLLRIVRVYRARSKVEGKYNKYRVEPSNSVRLGARDVVTAPRRS